jgi:DNA-binding YbaB/EbfC family protein
MTDLNELMQHARRMQEQMQKAQEEMANTIVQGESGAGMVQVSMNGRHDVKAVKLADVLLDEDKEVVEDLIAAAVNDAIRKLEDKNKEAMSGMAGGFQIPEGFKFPF